MAGTVCHVGCPRPAPGTRGSLAARPPGRLIHVTGGSRLLIIFVITRFINSLSVTLFATLQPTKGGGDHDPSGIVILEVAGQWIAILPLSSGAWHAGADIPAPRPARITALIAFRAPDIPEPGPVGRADRRNDAMGVMPDDVIAGVPAAFTVLIPAGIPHGRMGDATDLPAVPWTGTRRKAVRAAMSPQNQLNLRDFPPLCRVVS